jgi:hypothetical protein
MSTGPSPPKRFATKAPKAKPLDDHSRYVPGSRIHDDPTGEHAIHLLADCIHQYGRPDQILTDQGTQFHPARGDLSAFTEFSTTGTMLDHIKEYAISIRPTYTSAI